MHPNRKVILIILDGWGIAAPSPFNAISQAQTPNWDKLLAQGNYLTLSASGEDVGLPLNQMGNSEVGHMHIGAGRILQQDLTRIDTAMRSDTFEQNVVLKEAYTTAQMTGKRIHIFGLLSPGGVHSHENHIFKLLEFFKKLPSCQGFVHAFLDGRDTPPKSAKTSLEKLEKICDNSSITPASITGRYYAMDRDKRWDRIKACYDMLTLAQHEKNYNSSLAALEAAYARGESDEFVKPSLLNSFDGIQDGDVILFMNFRADRARQLSIAFTDPVFKDFERLKWPQVTFYTLTEYQKNLNAQVLFPPPVIRNTLGEVVAQHGLKQLRIAETEKYAHVSFFFNGGQENPFPGEERILLPSPKISTYDLKPEMSAYEVTEKVTEKIRTENYALIVLNFANADMVGHTGNFPATLKAIEAIDNCLGRIYKVCQTHSTQIVITADHGNAEFMFNEHIQQAHTAHTHNPVPFLHVGSKAHLLSKTGTLIDIAPTLLNLLELPVPQEMSGQPLCEFIE